MNVVSIGCCKGCTVRARLDDGVCRECLSSPRRGRAWALMSERVRTNREFAVVTYNRIKTDAGREVFVRMYGLPEGCNPPGLSVLR